jgi:hypothetical protein
MQISTRDARVAGTSRHICAKCQLSLSLGILPPTDAIQFCFGPRRRWSPRVECESLRFRAAAPSLFFQPREKQPRRIYLRIFSVACFQEVRKLQPVAISSSQTLWSRGGWLIGIAVAVAWLRTRPAWPSPSAALLGLESEMRACSSSRNFPKANDGNSVLRTHVCFPRRLLVGCGLNSMRGKGEQTFSPCIERILEPIAVGRTRQWNRPMSIEDCDSTAGRGAPVAPGEAAHETVKDGIGPTNGAPGSAGGRPLHRLAAARRQQGMSCSLWPGDCESTWPQSSSRNKKRPTRF